MVVIGLKGCAVYLDDIVVFSDTWEEHVDQICALFGHLADGGLTVNLVKCEFARATVVYLGCVVGQGQVRPVDAKVQAVARYPLPTTKQELMWYRSFCRNCSAVVAPLTDLLKSNAKFVWSPRCQSAFDNVKCLLCPLHFWQRCIWISRLLEIPRGGQMARAPIKAKRRAI